MNTPWGMFAIVRILDTHRSYPQEEGILSIPTLVSHTTSFPLILITTLPLFRRLCSSAYVIPSSLFVIPAEGGLVPNTPSTPARIRIYRLVASTLPVRQPSLILVRTQTIRREYCRRAIDTTPRIPYHCSCNCLQQQ